MRAFVLYMLRGRTQAITVSAVCAAMSFLLPPLSYLSGAVTGLATLRYGPLEGLFVVGGSVLLAGVFTFLVIGSPYPVLAFTVVTWIPVWLLALVLRKSASQGQALAVAGVLGACAVLGVHVVVGQPDAWWRSMLDDLVLGAMRQGDMPLGPETVAKVSELLDNIAPLMTGLVAAGTVFGLVMTLFLARWWHALVDNPGGFGREFRALRLDWRVAVVALVIGLVAAFGGGGTLGRFGGDLFWLAAVLYLMQGLAVAHAIVVGRGASVAWLVGLYVLLSFPHSSVPAIVLLALAGLADTWLDFRQRFCPSA